MERCRPETRVLKETRVLPRVLCTIDGGMREIVVIVFVIVQESGGVDLQPSEAELRSDCMSIPAFSWELVLGEGEIELVLQHTAGERSPEDNPGKAFPGLVKAVDYKIRPGSVKAVRARLCFNGVLGKVEGYTPSEREFLDFMKNVTESSPAMMRPKGDGSFLVKFSSPEEAELLQSTKVLFQGTRMVLLEPWKLQKDSESTNFSSKFVWV